MFATCFARKKTPSGSHVPHFNDHMFVGTSKDKSLTCFFCDIIFTSLTKPMFFLGFIFLPFAGGHELGLKLGLSPFPVKVYRNPLLNMK